MAFTPQTLPESSGTLIAHWAARLESYNDDDAVGTFNAQSGTSFDADQATAANKPTFKTGIVNGQSVFRFDGTDYMESGAVTDWKFLHNNSEFTIYVVWACSTADPDARYGILDTCAMASSNVGMAFWMDDLVSTPADERMRMLVGMGSGAVCDYGYDYGNVLDQFTISKAMHEVGEAEADWQIFSNRARVSWQSSNSQTPSAANSTYVLNIGRRAAGDSYLVGDIAEILIYTGNLSNTDDLYVYDHLSTFYRETQIPRSHGRIQTSSTLYDAFGFGIYDNAARVQIFARRGTTHVGDNGEFRRWYSSDRGVTWSSETVTDSAYDDRNMAGGLVQPSGKIIVFYGRYTVPSGPWVDIRIRSSVDHGESWSDDGAISVGSDTIFSPHGAMITLPSGKLMQTFYGDDGTNWRLYVQFSSDGGDTWTGEVEIENSITIKTNEGCAVHLTGTTDATAVLLCITRDSAGALRQYKSTNGGANWTFQGVLPFSSGIDKDVAPWLFRKGEDVYLTYYDRTREKLLLAWGDKDDVDDSVNNWTGPIIVFSSTDTTSIGSGYPCIFNVGKGDSVVMVFHDGPFANDPDFMYSEIPAFTGPFPPHRRVVS